MQYYMRSFDHANKLLISSIRFKYDIETTLDQDRRVSKLPKDVFEEYDNKLALIKEADFNELNFSYFSYSKQSFFCYYYFYMQLLYFLIHGAGCSYKWINLIDEDYFIERNLSNEVLKDFAGANPNPYIYKQDTKSLGLNILKNGMYFPFCEFNNEIIFGRHRLYSLLQHKHLLKDKYFLTIDLTPFSAYCGKNTFDFYTKEINKEFSTEIPCFIFNRNNNTLFRSMNKNIFVVYQYLLHFSDILPLKIFKMQGFNSPNPILNSQKLFDNFINSPFSYIKELEPKN